MGFPTLKNEDWKYTNVEPIAAQSFALANGEAKSIVGAEVFSRALFETDAPTAGRSSMAFTRRRCPTRQTCRTDCGLGRWQNSSIRVTLPWPRSSANLRASETATFCRAQYALLLAMAPWLSLAPGCRLQRPIYLLFVSTAGAQPVMSQPRILLLLGAGSEAKIVESYLGVSGKAYFCNAVTELIGAEDSIVEHYRLQQEGDAGFHVGTLAASLARNCHLTAHAVTLSGALVRNDVRVLLERRRRGVRAQWPLSRRWQAACRQLHRIEHASPRASSRELYKGILGGAAHGVFNGKIIVHKDAQKSDARQTNKNLILVGGRGRQHQTATGNSCRRCQMQPWIDHRPVGSPTRYFICARAAWMWRTARSLVELCLCQRRGAADE